MPRRRKAAPLQVTGEQYEMCLSARMELAEDERTMEAGYKERPEVMAAMELTGRTKAKDALGKMIILAMMERGIDKEEYDDGSSVTMTSSERKSLDRDLLTAELERREIDPDDIVQIINAATAVTSFQAVRVSFAKVERARGRGRDDTRLRR